MSDELNDDELESEIEPTEEVENTEEVEVETHEVETEDNDEALKEKNTKLFQRAKKAEAEAKALKAKLAEKAEVKPTNNDALSREEAILIAQGMDSEDLDELKDVAKAKGISLLKAKEAPLFQGYLEKRQAERKKEKAKLNSSKGSQVQQETSIKDLTTDEHKALVKEMAAKIR